MLGLIASLPLLFAQAPPDANGAAPVAATPSAARVNPPAAGAAPAAGAPAAGAPAATPQPSLISTLIPLLPIPILFYFLMIRPQQQQERKRKEMVNTVGKNARVVTAGGIYGTVVSSDPESETVLLRLGTDPGVKVEFSRASIVRVLEGGDKAKSEG